MNKRGFGACIWPKKRKIGAFRTTYRLKNGVFLHIWNRRRFGAYRSKISATLARLKVKNRRQFCAFWSKIPCGDSPSPLSNSSMWVGLRVLRLKGEFTNFLKFNTTLGHIYTSHFTIKTPSDRFRMAVMAQNVVLFCTLLSLHKEKTRTTNIK